MSKQKNPSLATIFQLGMVAGKLDPKDVKFTRLWAPGPRDVIVSNQIKSSYLHSLNAGVLMSLINLPFFIWDIVLKPLGKSLMLLAVVFLTRLLAGFRGIAHAVDVDEESLLKAIEEADKRESKQRMEKLFASMMGDIKNAVEASGKDLGDPDEVTATLHKVEDGKIVETQRLTPPPELVAAIKRIHDQSKLGADDQADKQV